MNWIFATTTIWSFRKELIYISLAVLFFLLLPLFAVFVITHAGFDIISDALVQVDSETRAIQIRNPSDGSIMKEVTAEIAWPVEGVYTLEFGESSGYQAFHAGLDIANPHGRIGDPITPFMDGTITKVSSISWGYGNYVVIDHGDNISSIYAHLSRIYVEEDQEVKIGDVIGTMGTTGWSTGPHLHFEVRVFGIPVNPRAFF